jgi:hypothetical protein
MAGSVSRFGSPAQTGFGGASGQALIFAFDEEPRAESAVANGMPRRGISFGLDHFFYS